MVIISILPKIFTDFVLELKTSADITHSSVLNCPSYFCAKQATFKCLSAEQCVSCGTNQHHLADFPGH